MSDLTFWIIHEETGDASLLTQRATHTSRGYMNSGFKACSWKTSSCPPQPAPPPDCPLHFLQPFIQPFILPSRYIWRRSRCIYSKDPLTKRCLTFHNFTLRLSADLCSPRQNWTPSEQSNQFLCVSLLPSSLLVNKRSGYSGHWEIR